VKISGFCLLALALLGPGGVEAVTLKESPVRDAMRASIHQTRTANPAGVNLALDEFDAGETIESSSAGKKSIFKAALFSALVPGGGHYYLGRKKSARYFFAAEALTWIGYISFRTYGNWKKDDYINYAAVYANAQLEGKSEEHLNYVGFYENIREFNSFGRAYDPDRAYLPDTPENHWEWQSPEMRQGFRDLRNRSKEAYRRSDFMVGLAVINRVIAIIDAVRTVGRVNRAIGGDQFGENRGRSLKLSVNPFSTHRQVSLTLFTGM
jgi:hypothetical protein